MTSALFRRPMPARDLHAYRKAMAGAQLEQRRQQAMFTLSRQLPTTLELEPLVRLFADIVHKVVPFDGLSLEMEGEDFAWAQGVEAQHHAEYGLRLNEQRLGTLTLMRRFPFGKDELEVFEDLLAFLLYPLRNALLYRYTLRLALRDPLTGVGNRLAFDEALAREIVRAGRHDGRLALMMLDMDGFKEVNDRHGHLVGDELLKHFARLVKATARGSDMLFRFGGDEFALLMPETDMDGARQLARRLREVLVVQPLLQREETIPLQSSIGVAQWLPGEGAAAFTARADAALYEDKRSRRAGACCA
ncbi:GGDEF domain-containing protein [Thiofaba sp. EF100]|uniref:GGDEF domain-containing protein n=1 Tax=Thiofaba sp. EF100 TaxID=3121274 RepID=UPI003221F86F